MPIFTTVIHSHGICEADFIEDEYQIEAASPPAAIAEATRIWRQTVQSRWPDNEIDDAFVLPEDVDPEVFSPADAIR